MSGKGVPWAVGILALFVLGFWLAEAGWQIRLVPNRSVPREWTEYKVRQEPVELSSAYELEGGPERTGRGFPQREILDLASEFPGLVFNQGDPKEKKVALTFDDGPDAVTTVQILDILKEHNVKATFFVIGKRAEVDEAVLKRMADEGHVIGNHTWNHPNLMKLDEARIAEEILKVEELVEKVVGYRPKLFRSPYGSLSRENVKQVANLGCYIIAWNVDSLDWKGLSGEQVRTNILENIRNGAIVLQHSAGGPGEDLSGTVAALPVIITTLKKEGYQFVTVPELLNIPYKKD
ncbi:MAG TPA: polysaccharide deacetylase family protein [Clostridia bacterium]|nr:polysaccharide deacetylase family protein [Clostridia bacterium]